MFTSQPAAHPVRDAATTPPRGSGAAKVERPVLVPLLHSLAVSAALAIDAMNLERAMAGAGLALATGGPRPLGRPGAAPRRALASPLEFTRRYRIAMETLQGGEAPLPPTPAIVEKASPRGGAHAYGRTSAGAAGSRCPASTELALSA